MENVVGYPLQWPAGWKKTDSWRRKKAKFKNNTLARARDGMLNQLALMGCSRLTIVISSNVPLRRDGLPHGDWERKYMSDPGVAVYFVRKGKPQVIACDQYSRVEDNLHAVELTIEALRGIERWGSSELLERTFTGFDALPPPPPPKETPRKRPWREVLGYTVGAAVTQSMLVSRRNQLAFESHPDRGGSHERMAEINRAYDEALMEVR